MSDPSSGGNDANTPNPGVDARLADRLETLGAELEARRAEMAPASESASAAARGHGMAMKLAAEFIAGILVGGAVGWFLDGWFGTSPWGLIIFLLLGFAAGVLNALRTAGLVQESPARQTPGRGDAGSAG